MMYEFTHYESIVPYMDEVPHHANELTGGEAFISRLLDTPEGRVAIAKVMVEPIKISLMYTDCED